MQFDFGKNWEDYSKNALTLEKVSKSKEHFLKLLEGIEIKSKSFLDIGFGQGLGILSAKSEGAFVIGCDINPKCAEVLKLNSPLFNIKPEEMPVVVGSILDPDVVQKIEHINSGKFDVVHSWGVLHHTGKMKSAIKNAASLVKPNGYFVIAIYNRHWSSLLWLFIKWFYCKSPVFLQKIMIKIFYPIIYLAKWIVTGQNPKNQLRGMDFFYDVIDWVGGYPYEYASTNEINLYVENLGFKSIKTVTAQVPTGCNEFVFRRN